MALADLLDAAEMIQDLIPAAIEAAFLRVDVGNDLALDEAFVGDGQDDVGVAIGVFGFLSDSEHFTVYCLRFDDMDAAQSPGDIVANSLTSA